MRSPYIGRPATLANVLEQGDGLTATCERRTCMHAAKLDVAALAERLGREATVPDLRQRLSCTKCGSRDVAITRVVHPPKPRLV